MAHKSDTELLKQHNSARYFVENRQLAGVLVVGSLVLGDLVGNAVQVASGLLPGDRVVVQGASLLEDGQAVRLVP